MVSPAFSDEPRKIINVAVSSHQPPIVIDHGGKVGLVYDLMEAFNQIQDKYEFNVRLLPPKRLALDTAPERKQHVMAFLDLNWGWKEKQAKGSAVLIEGKDVFFQLKDPQARDAAVHEIGAVRGYHYAFANYDTSRLEVMENVRLVRDEEAVARLVFRGRVSKGISSLSYLNWMSVSRPDDFARLEILLPPDHIYHRQLIVMPDSPISVTRINELLFTLKELGTLRELFDRYGLPIPSLRVMPES